MFGSRVGSRFVLISAAAAIAAGIVPAVAASASSPASNPCPSCGHNLIVNPGAETGKGANGDIKVKTPGWKQTKNFTETLYTWSGGNVGPTTPRSRSSAARTTSTAARIRLRQPAPS